MKINNPVTCEQLIRTKIQFNPREPWCVALFTHCELLEYRRLGFGGLSQSPLLYRRILHFSLQTGAEQMILVHSHPDTHSFPTDEDLFWTEKIINFFDQLDLKLNDHIIISRYGFTSLLHHDPNLFE